MKDFFKRWIFPPLLGAAIYTILQYLLDPLLSRFLVNQQFAITLLDIKHLSLDQQAQEIYFATRKLRWLYHVLPGLITIFFIKNRNWKQKIIHSILIYVFHIAFLGVLLGPIGAIYAIIFLILLMPIFVLVSLFGMYLGELLINRQYLKATIAIAIVISLATTITLLRQIPNTPLSTNITDPDNPLLLEIKQELLLPFCLAGQQKSNQELTQFFTEKYLQRTIKDGKQRWVDGRLQLLRGESELLSNIRYDHEYLYRLDDGLSCDSLMVNNRKTALKREELLEPADEPYRKGQYHFSFKPFSNVKRHVWIEKTATGWKIDHISGTN